ncbi:MAG TPA: hypothetical protein VEF04_20715, partial [Blastocatellia bacterium]|nr:hypothetical protein [Blastocatellia bacterium]
VIATYGPTLFVDEFNPANTQDDANQLMPILNSGFMRDFLVGRSEKSADGQFTAKLFSPFCPKIIASYKPLDSAAFESRGHQLLMVKTERRDIPLSATETMRQDALHLSNKLLLFRLRNYHRDWETGLRQAQDALWQENLAPRAIQISAGLYSLMDSAEDRAEFIKMLKGRESRESEDKQASFDGQLITTLHSQIIVSDSDGQVDWLSGITPEEFEDGKPVRYWRTDTIAERMNEDREEKRKLTKEYVGKAIRKLHLNTAKIKTRGADRDKPAIQWDRNRVRQLFLSFGLPLPKNFPENTSENASPASPASPNTLFAIRTDICTGTQDGDALGTESDSVESPQVGTQPELLLSPTAVPTQLIDIEGESEFGDSGDAGDAENEGTEKKFSEDVLEFIALDTETEAFDKKRGITPRNCRMIGLALCYDGERADYETDREAWPLLMPEAEQRVVMHNAKFDLGVLKRSGLPVPEKWEDTLIAAHLLDEYSSHGLKPLAKEHLGIEDPITFSEADRMRLLDPEVFNEYARNDARYTHRLWSKFKRELDRQGLQRAYNLEKAVLPVVMKMEERGLRIDIAQMDVMRAEVETETKRL